MTIQERLDEMTPYVTAIRYADIPIVDISIPKTWGVPESKTIGVSKVDSDENVIKCLIYGNADTKVSIDELLDYIGRAIKLNIEREKKHVLLKEQIAELTNVFSKHSLSMLKKLRFTFEDDKVDTIPLGELDGETEEPDVEPDVESDEVFEEEVVKESEKEVKVEQTEKEPVVHQTKSGVKIDLPPKKVGKPEKPVLETFDGHGCNCGAGESCPDCTDY